MKTTSKSLQDPSIDIEKSILLHHSLISYFEKLRNDKSFADFESRGQYLIASCCSGSDNNPEVTYNCYNKRVRKRNSRYDVGNGPDTDFDDGKKFRVDCYYAALDSILLQLRDSTSAYVKIMKPFVFSISLDNQTLSDEQLRHGAEQLRSIYVDDLDDGNYFLMFAFN